MRVSSKNRDLPVSSKYRDVRVSSKHRSYSVSVVKIQHSRSKFSTSKGTCARDANVFFFRFSIAVVNLAPGKARAQGTPKFSPRLLH